MRNVDPEFLADMLDETIEDWSQYYNIQTGEVESIPDKDSAEYNSEYAAAAARIAADRNFVRLPGSRELDEKEIMEQFAGKTGSDELWEALESEYPVIAFRDELEAQALDDEYYSFRHQIYLEKILAWCSEFDIPVDEG